MIVVTGATGFVGEAVVRELRAAGHIVRILVRRPGRAAALSEKYGVEIVAGDIGQPEALAKAFTGARAVIHLVGIIAETRHAAYQQIHVEGTRNVVEACHRSGIKRFIHMSALGTRAGALARYHQTKWEGEELVRNSHLDWTIFRPSLIYGSRDQFINLFALFLRFPIDFLQLYVLPNPLGGWNRVQPVPVEEVAWAVVRAVANDRAVGRVLDLCGPEPWAMRDLLQLICRIKGRRSRLEDHPGRLLFRLFAWGLMVLAPLLAVDTLRITVIPWLVAGLLGIGVVAAGIVIVDRVILIQGISLSLLWPTACFWEGLWHWGPTARILEKIVSRPPLTRDQILMLEEDNVGDPLPAATLFRFTPRSLEDGIRAYLTAR